MCEYVWGGGGGGGGGGEGAGEAVGNIIIRPVYDSTQTGLEGELNIAVKQHLCVCVSIAHS